MTDTKTAEKLDLGIKIAGLGLGEVDYIQDTITLDARGAGFFDLPADTPVSRTDLHNRIHPEDWPSVKQQVSCLFSPDKEDFISVVHRVIAKDLSVKWLSARKQVTFDGVFEDGSPKPVSGLVAIQDITPFKEAEARIEYLLGEVTHRSKNMLSVVQGIARLTEKNSKPEDFMRQFSARLTALSANQTTLINDQWAALTMAHLVRAQMKPYAAESQNRLSIDGPDVQLNETAAQAIGMALHELATNAIKYGALSNSDGTVEIRWDVKGLMKKEFYIEWTEVGGPPVLTPTRKGFGETVIRQMASSSVSGTVSLDYDPSGVQWSLKAPLENIRP